MVVAIVVVFIVGTTVQWLLHKDARGMRWVKSAHTVRVHVNTDPIDQLQMLPAIGPTLAAKIISYRQTNGPFLKIEDLRKVKGITDRRLRRMRELLEL